MDVVLLETSNEPHQHQAIYKVVASFSIDTTWLIVVLLETPNDHHQAF